MLDIKDISDCKLKIKTDKNVIEITFSELTLDKKVIIFGFQEHLLKPVQPNIYQVL